MQAMKFFVDTHDTKNDTFPAWITPEQFEDFFAQYTAVCAEENVVILRVHVAYEDGKAFCFTMAPDADSVRRAHERVSLPFDGISEVQTATPGDTFFRKRAA
ncbi:DUF4242 domain-containing protein [Magnetospira sp. QH-2]|uniref:DUF4242 domain-containing protein n=1 Tax=Magnetospira sp. (strain QH-2) TaxID=1288970 RepID=UPI0003E8144D|nr:DUF4242 domain-containing protein [Magnetospira sp. QH-2]CCQ75016.1 conserved protein of unknown function [Magnetospira sp. QH-2]